MDHSKQSIRQEERRVAIRKAARECFLNFGYSRTSLEDIAEKAGISRPLIYLQFKSKEAVLMDVFESIFKDRYPAAENAATQPGDKQDRLLRVHEILVLEPWEEIMTGTLMASEFYKACKTIAPESEGKPRRVLLKCAQAVLGSKARAEVFTLAAEGLRGDFPTAAVLRRRLILLIGCFVG